LSFTCKEPERLDTFLAQAIQAPRNQVLSLIKTHGVYVNKTLICKAGLKLQIGDEITIPQIPTSQEPQIKVDFDIPIIYEDRAIMVINKPPFLTVHPAPSVKEATVVDWLKSRRVKLSTLSGQTRHGIVHRIDKETSGALVVAKTNEAHAGLAAQLEDKSMGRFYLAIIDLPLKSNCIVDKPIARNPKNRLKMAIISDGRNAKSAFCKLALAKDEQAELIGAKLFTGRTHQIRVHLESLSRHILGDNLYGFKSQKATIPRVMLHAYGIYLNHPITNKPLMFQAPFYEDFESILTQRFTRESYNDYYSLATLKCRFYADDFRLYT